MSGYFAIFCMRMKTLFQYRAAALAGIATQLFWGIVMVMIFRAFYAETSAHMPLSLTQAITFVWLQQAFVQIVPWNIDKEVEAQVKNGNVAYELVRPLHLYGLWFTRALAQRSIPTALRCLPIFFFAGGWLDLSAPVSFEAGIAFGGAIFCALLLSAAITTLVVTTLFWTLSGEGAQRLLPHLTVLLSGMVVPLPLFPNWMQPFLNLQPFRGILDIPCRLYTGVIPASEAPYYWGFQLMWTVFFIWAGKRLMQKAVRQFVVQGG